MAPGGRSAVYFSRAGGIGFLCYYRRSCSLEPIFFSKKIVSFGWIGPSWGPTKNVGVHFYFILLAPLFFTIFSHILFPIFESLDGDDFSIRFFFWFTSSATAFPSSGNNVSGTCTSGTVSIRLSVQLYPGKPGKTQ